MTILRHFRAVLSAICLAASWSAVSFAETESEVTKLEPFAVNGRPLRMPYDGRELFEAVVRLTDGFSHFRFGGLAILNATNQIDERYKLLLWEKMGPRLAPAERIAFLGEGVRVSEAMGNFFVTSSGLDSESVVCVFQEHQFQGPLITSREFTTLWREYRDYVTRLKKHIEVLYGIRDFDQERACASVMEWLSADEIVVVFKSELAARAAAERTGLRQDADKLHIGAADLTRGIGRVEIGRDDIRAVLLWNSGTPCVVSADGRGVARISNFGYKKNRLSKPKLNAVVPVFRPFGETATYSRIKK